MEPKQDQPQSWQAWLTERQLASTMETARIPLDQVGGGWAMQADRFGRPDGKFFALVGTKVSTGGGEREITSWGQPLIEELGPGVIILVADESDRFLIQAVIEPGNPTVGHVLLGPTMQASISNLQQAHGGRRPHRAELFDRHSAATARFVQDGGKFDGKVNQYMVLNLLASGISEVHPNERWFTRAELRQALWAGALNEHLLQALALAFV